MQTRKGLSVYEQFHLQQCQGSVVGSQLKVHNRRRLVACLSLQCSIHCLQWYVNIWTTDHVVSSTAPTAGPRLRTADMVLVKTPERTMHKFDVRKTMSSTETAAM